MGFKRPSNYKSSFDEIVATLVAIVEQKDQMLKVHAERVAGICVNFARQLFRVDTAQFEKVYFASLLHEFGKIYLPDDILYKSDGLTPAEQKQYEAVPVIGAAVLSNINAFKDVVRVIRHSHEAFDGSGYPDGLKGEQIPIESRILNLVDAFDKLMAAEDNRHKPDREAIIAKLAPEAGKRFDPKLFFKFKQFIKTVDDKVLASSETSGDTTLRDIFLKITHKFKAGKLDLPVLPRIAEEVKYVTGKKSSSLADIAKVIETDAVISVKLISIANSPIYRGVEKIDDVRTAISRMGIRETQNVVSAIAQKSLYQTRHREFEKLLEKLWQHSLATAYASSAIAKHLKLKQPERLFMIGLVHDIGAVLLLRALADLIGDHNPYSLNDIKACIDEVQTSFARAMLTRWNFDRAFIQMATLHASTDFSPDTDKRVLMINLASHLAIHIGCSLFEEQDDIELPDRDSARLLKIDETSLEDIGKEIEEVMKGTANLF